MFLERTILTKVKSRTDVDSGYGTGGAIRRIRSKFASETPGRRSASLYSLQEGPLQLKECNASKVFFQKEKNMKLTGTSGTANNQPVTSLAYGSREDLLTSSPQSSPTARGILEHLVNKPTPNELVTELKIASAWKNYPSKSTDVMQYKVTSSTQLRGIVDLRKNINGLKFSVAGSGDGENLTSREKYQESDALNAITINSGKNAFMDAKRQDQDAKSWPFHKQVNGQDDTTKTTYSAGPELLKKQPSHFSGTKTNLMPLSVDKLGGLGFTFPVSASAVLSEPPTPSIIPSFSSGGMPQATEESALPSYTFGTKSSCCCHDFSSFPSTSTTSTSNEASDIKFKFGSDRERLGFLSN